jgi:hypothetical protein
MVSDKVYEQFVYFAKLARSCFAEHGEDVHRAIYAKKNTGPFQLKEFHPGQVKYFPLVVDFFVRFYLPDTDSKEAKEANQSLMEVIAYDFCKWLSKSELTKIKVNMSRAVEIDFKPPVNLKQKSTPGKVEEHKEQ